MTPEPHYKDSGKTKGALEMLKQITLEEVKKHNTRDSAWTAVNGIVYDVTNFLNSHPGGLSNIFRSVGKDGTTVFSKFLYIYH